MEGLKIYLHEPSANITVFSILRRLMLCVFVLCWRMQSSKWSARVPPKIFFFSKQVGTNRRQGAGIAQSNGLQMGWNSQQCMNWEETE